MFVVIGMGVEAAADVYHDLDHVNRQGRCLMAGRKSLPRVMTFKLIPKSSVRKLRGMSIESTHLSALNLVFVLPLTLCRLGILVVQGSFHKCDFAAAVHENNSLLLRPVAASSTLNFNPGLG